MSPCHVSRYVLGCVWVCVGVCGVGVCVLLSRCPTGRFGLFTGVTSSLCTGPVIKLPGYYSGPGANTTNGVPCPAGYYCLGTCL